MKKIMLTAVALIGLTATAQVKIGSDVQNLAAGANFQVEGSSAANQFVIMNSTGNVGIGTKTPAQKLTIEDGSIFMQSANTLVRFGISQFVAGTDMITRIGQNMPNTVFGQTVPSKKGAYISFENRSSINTFDIAINSSVGANGELFMLGIDGGDDAAPITNGKVILGPHGGSDKATETLDVTGTTRIRNLGTSAGTDQIVVADANGKLNKSSVTASQLNSVSTTAVAAGTTVQGFVGGNAEFSAINTGVIMRSPNGDKWKVTIGDGGVLTIVKAL